MSGCIYTGADVSPMVANYGQIGYQAVPFNRGWAQNGWTQTSDGNLKTSVDLPYGLNEILQINPIAYKWKTQSDLADGDPEKTHIYYGVDARQIYTCNILPEFCYMNCGSNCDTLMINYSELTAVLINAVKDQQKQIVELQSAIATLTSNIEFAPIQKSTTDLGRFFSSNPL